MARRPKPSGSTKTPRTVEALLERLDQLGVEVELTGGDHYRVHCPDGFVVLAQTPSDHRSVPNAVSIMRRYGLKI